MKVLVVEDQPSIRKVLTSMIRTLGHEVVDVESADVAYKVLVKGGTQFDLVLSDNNTGEGMTGLDLLARLRIRSQADTWNLKFVLTSGDTHFQERSLDEICKELNATFHPKPLMLKTLKQILETP